MIFYKRKGGIKTALARKSAEEFKNEKKCPHCQGELVLADQGKDRDTFLCQKCGDVATFTRRPFEDAPKTRKLNTLTLRDRTTKAYKHCDSPNKKPLKDMPKETGVVLKKIRKGMAEHVLVGFAYEDAQGTRTERVVEPYKITIKGGEIVLFGYDIESQGIRIFKLGSIAAIDSQPYSFKPRWEIEDKLENKTTSAKE